MSKDGRFPVLVAAVVLFLFPLLGARAEGPARPSTNDYPSVLDVPPRPEKPAMTTDEQSKLKKELNKARDRQAPKGKATEGAAHRSQ
jgi:hypothetical protein